MCVVCAYVCYMYGICGVFYMFHMCLCYVVCVWCMCDMCGLTLVYVCSVWHVSVCGINMVCDSVSV